MNIAATQSSDSGEWGTPPWLITMIEDEFGRIDLDPAATAENSVGKEFFTKEDNGLLQPWHGVTFVNCPYSQVATWATKAYMEAHMGNATVLFLCAARPDTRYWWQCLRHGEVRFIKGRIKFVGAKGSAPFPSALVVFDRWLNRTPSTVYWDIPKERRE